MVAISHEGFENFNEPPRKPKNSRRKAIGLLLGVVGAAGLGYAAFDTLYSKNAEETEPQGGLRITITP